MARCMGSQGINLTRTLFIVMACVLSLAPVHAEVVPDAVVTLVRGTVRYLEHVSAIQRLGGWPSFSDPRVKLVFPHAEWRSDGLIRKPTRIPPSSPFMEQGLLPFPFGGDKKGRDARLGPVAGVSRRR